MNAVYRMIGISKQAFHQRMNHYLRIKEEQQNLIPIIQQIRLDHPRMSARKMYQLICPGFMGRDRFEAFCFENGFKLQVKRSWRKTTNSLGVTRFPNLIMNFKVTGVNQVWVSDITYYQIGDRFYYLTFIMDLYSRRIIGHSVSKDLQTEHTTIVALRRAIRLRKPFKNLILHSDGGGQYYCKEFLKITQKYDIKNSMCDTVYENPHAERVNGTLKNDYIIYYNPEDFEQLEQKSDKAVTMYNNIKPHASLSGLSPVSFEKLSIKTNGINTEKKREIEKEAKTSFNFENRNKNLLKTVNPI